MTSTNLPKIAPGITTQWQRFDELSAPALYQLLRFRQQIFVVEQRSPYPDLDGLDQRAAHLLLRNGVISPAVCGCCRGSRSHRRFGLAASRSLPGIAGVGWGAS